jgi:hypothetical protein
MTDSPPPGPSPSGPPETRWTRHPESLWRATGDTVVVLPGAGDDPTPLSISGSAARLWELLAQPVSLGELAAQLADAYGADAEVIAADLAPVLEDLRAAAAVERSP